jgi:glycosyltransferase involved in cell wall biosynthesis
MRDKICISVIVPFYNAEHDIERCLDVLSAQEFSRSFEIVLVDDGSTDNSRRIAERHTCANVKLFSLISNSGPAAARNVGLNKSVGEYILFLDVDDTIKNVTLEILYQTAKEDKCDLVICDKQRIENSVNQREGIFLYPEDRRLGDRDIIEAMRQRYFDPITSMGLFGLTGRLIKRSIISNNKLQFEEKLRYWEDEIFSWDLFAYVHSITYVRRQLYAYHVNPNVNSGVSAGLDRPFPISNFKLARSRIKNSLQTRQFSSKVVEELSDQALIFFIISALVSYSRSIILGKVDPMQGARVRRKMIDEVFADHEIVMAVSNYQASKEESQWIPRAIVWRSRKLLEAACIRRAKKVLDLRRTGRA